MKVIGQYRTEGPITIEHDCTGDTKVSGLSCPPYSSQSCGAPEEVKKAVRRGFGASVPEFDMRTFEWRDDV
jgi:hypothetical protein